MPYLYCACNVRALYLCRPFFTTHTLPAARLHACCAAAARTCCRCPCRARAHGCAAALPLPPRCAFHAHAHAFAAPRHAHARTPIPAFTCLTSSRHAAARAFRRILPPAPSPSPAFCLPLLHPRATLPRSRRQPPPLHRYHSAHMRCSFDAGAPSAVSHVTHHAPRTAVTAGSVALFCNVPLRTVPCLPCPSGTPSVLHHLYLCLHCIHCPTCHACRATPTPSTPHALHAHPCRPHHLTTRTHHLGFPPLPSRLFLSAASPRPPTTTPLPTAAGCCDSAASCALSPWRVCGRTPHHCLPPTLPAALLGATTTTNHHQCKRICGRRWGRRREGEGRGATPAWVSSERMKRGLHTSPSTLTPPCFCRCFQTCWYSCSPA